MLRLEELEALDLQVWLQSGATAASVAGTNQSTVCRRSRRALDSFHAELQRDREVWQVQTPLAQLLDLQRQIHQQWRFRAGRGLRLSAPAWSRAALRACSLPGWIITPEDGPLVCENPLELLRAHVIDACLLTPTQLAGQPQADLALFDLYDSHIDLHLIAAGEPETPAAISSQAARDLLIHSRLQLLPFLPSSCCLSSRQRLQQLRRELGLDAGDTGAAPQPGAAAPPRLVFLTPVMARGLAVLRPLPLPLEWPYRESLAVLRSSAEQPAVQALVENLQGELPRTLQKLVPGGAVPIH